MFWVVVCFVGNASHEGKVTCVTHAQHVGPHIDRIKLGGLGLKVRNINNRVLDYSHAVCYYLSSKLRNEHLVQFG